MNKKTVLILLPVFFSVALSFLGVFQFASGQETEVTYPTIQGVETPTTTRVAFSKYIQYFFYLAIFLSGFIAFGAIVMGGVKHLASAGNPSLLADARSQILYGILAVVLLLGSYILLNSINPQLTKLELSKCQAQGTKCLQGGIVLCKDANCTENPEGEEGVDFIRLKSSASCLVGCTTGNDEGFQAGSMWYGNSSNELDVILYEKKNYNNKVWDSREQGFINAGDVISLGKKVNSVKMIWKMPGIYLFSEANCKGNAQLYTTNMTTLHLDNVPSPKSLYILPRISSKQNVEEKLGAILHEHENPPIDGGDAELILGNRGGPTTKGTPMCVNLSDGCDNDRNTFCIPGNEMGDRASALTVFKQVVRPISDKKAWGDGVTIFGNYDLNEQAPYERNDDEQIHCGPINLRYGAWKYYSDGTPKPLMLGIGTIPEIGQEKLYSGGENESQRDCKKLLEEKVISSIKVDGKFIAVLFREDGRGEVFFKDDPRLNDNHIGDNAARYLLVIPIQER